MLGLFTVCKLACYMCNQLCLCLFNFRCKRDSLQHLATCTDPITKDNIHYDDSSFCPYQPSVSISKSLPILPHDSEPLDFMSYFVDERLMEMAESEDPVEFFKKYMAGFVISKRESAVSRCGSVNNDISINNADIADIRDLMCFMFSTTQVVRSELLFTDSVTRQYRINDLQCSRFKPFLTYDATVSCSTFNTFFISEYENSGNTQTQYLNCSNAVLNVNTFSFEIGQNTTSTMMIDDNFEVDGTIRHLSDDIDIEGVPIVGRIYAPYGSNAEILEATIYYNNQVINCCQCNAIIFAPYSLSICQLLH